MNKRKLKLTDYEGFTEKLKPNKTTNPESCLLHKKLFQV